MFLGEGAECVECFADLSDRLIAFRHGIGLDLDARAPDIGREFDELLRRVDRRLKFFRVGVFETFVGTDPPPRQRAVDQPLADLFAFRTAEAPLDTVFVCGPKFHTRQSGLRTGFDQRRQVHVLAPEVGAQAEAHGIGRGGAGGQRME